MASTIAEQVDVSPVAATPPGKDDEFTSTSLPIRMGNSLPIAYGGCAMSVAVNAAARTVASDSHRLYSVVGHFHGPATLDQPFRCAVTRTRDTRSFATRRVRVSQLQPQPQPQRDPKGGGGGEPQERTCLELIADFHAVEDALLTFSAPPSRAYAPPPESPTSRELHAELAGRGLVEAGAAGIPASFATMFDGHERFFETRFCRASMSGQNLGWAAHVPTDQDALPLTARSSAEWYRALPADGRGGGRALRTHAEHCAALAFLMDGGLAFLPLVHSHRRMEDSGAASSLDFALRIITPDVDMERWHVRDRVAHAGGAGRSFTEGRLYDEQGRLVASMTQQGILRPPPKAKSAL